MLLNLICSNRSIVILRERTRRNHQKPQRLARDRRTLSRSSGGKLLRPEPAPRFCRQGPSVGAKVCPARRLGSGASPQDDCSGAKFGSEAEGGAALDSQRDRAGAPTRWPHASITSCARAGEVLRCAEAVVWPWLRVALPQEVMMEMAREAACCQYGDDVRTQVRQAPAQTITRVRAGSLSNAAHGRRSSPRRRTLRFPSGEFIRSAGGRHVTRFRFATGAFASGDDAHPMIHLRMESIEHHA